MNTIEPVFVDFIPETLVEGKLYVSLKFDTATHLCCCGCGLETVTPLGLEWWTIYIVGQTVSLFPSIGNWQFPCRSHYWIKENRVEWA